MSKKRTCSKQQTSGGSDSFPQDGDVKRARLGSRSETTLEDLPLELIESILIKTIVMEVKELNLANSVWKEKADLVISRLCTVCSHWSNILTTNFFRNELHRTLDSAQQTILLEILHQSLIQDWIFIVAAMKDEIFLRVLTPPLQTLRIDVYDRNNMAVVKDVIPLPGISPHTTVPCSVSNCLYMLNRLMYDDYFSLVRIARGNDNRFIIAPLMEYLHLPQASMCVSSNGNLILVRKQTERFDAITVCDANGYVQHTVRLPVDVNRFDRIISKSNGNLILVQLEQHDHFKTKLMEITMSGDIVRQYQSSTDLYPSVCDADNNGRMLISDDTNRMELLDSEFNLMELHVTGPQPIGDQYNRLHFMHYNVSRNEMVTITIDRNIQNSLLTIFHLL